MSTTPAEQLRHFGKRTKTKRTTTTTPAEQPRQKDDKQVRHFGKQLKHLQKQQKQQTLESITMRMNSMSMGILKILNNNKNISSSGARW